MLQADRREALWCLVRAELLALSGRIRGGNGSFCKRGDEITEGGMGRGRGERGGACTWFIWKPD